MPEENQMNAEITPSDFISPEQIEIARSGKFAPVFTGKTTQEIYKLAVKIPKGLSHEDEMLRSKTAYSIIAVELEKLTRKIDVELLFNQGGSFILKDGQTRTKIYFHYCANNNYGFSSGVHFEFWTDDKTPTALSETGYRSSFPNNPIGWASSFEDYLTRVVKSNVQGNAKGKKAKTAAELVEISDVTFERTKIREGHEYRQAQQTKAVTVFSDTVIPIRISDITASPFEPQARRRARFKDEEIESLGNSIVEHSLQQPILVRQLGIGANYEIVFGERRFLAVARKGIKTINCFVRDLTDAQVLELQYEENHRRQENHPLDDAFFFKFLMEKENYTEEDLSDRLNTSRQNVTNKLVLNDLIPAAARELSGGLLPLKHAYFLARFPVETQELIVKEQHAYKYNDRTEKATSFKTFVEEVEQNITRKLENAPFSTIDPRLHIKKLICPDCPQRTGFAPSLFTDLSKGDSCLNKSCFEIKTNTHLRLKRDEIALSKPNPTNASIEEIVKEVPLVTDRVWTDKKTLGEKPLTKQEFLEQPQCEFSEISLIVEGSRKGQSTYICREKACAVHNPQPPAPDLTDAAFVRRVELLTREKVLAKSLEAFSDYKPVWMYDDLVQKLIVELWIGKGVEAQKSIMRIIRDWKELPKAFYSRGEVDSFVRSLDKTKQSQIIFLLLFHLNTSTDEIKKISDDYARLDYRIIEAEARLELAPESEKELARDILTVTRGGVNDLRKPDFDLDAVH